MSKRKVFKETTKKETLGTKEQRGTITDFSLKTMLDRRK